MPGVLPNGIQKSPLDPNLLSLGKVEEDFFKEQTGIHDIEELKRHITRIQEEAYKKFPYPCIRRFLFTNLQITRLPDYENVLNLGRTRPDCVLLDVGCCFGHDIRFLISNGFPAENIVALDIKRDLWDLGMKLFNSDPNQLPVHFLEGDIFSNEVLDLQGPNMPVFPLLQNLNGTLNPLKTRISVIHVSLVFHLFSEEKQLELAHRLAALLSPLPGSIIFGNHISLSEKGIHPNNTSGIRMFCHSPESWQAMWDGVVFPKGTVEVKSQLVSAAAMHSSKSSKEDLSNFDGRDTDSRWGGTMWLLWSVRRI
ncbi:hypothetical protein M422DRAFT_156563 [Sphaerobolus stellatus SS14]|nr:hypothetical protein M422DRAFT_156563 [Sphaerobolus stellatus SS14]